MIFLNLVTAYRDEGYDVRVGLNPNHFGNYKQVPFAVLSRDGQPFHTGGGISIQEIYFFENLATHCDPERIFIIGNAFGWSTIALSMIFPKAKVVAIDNVSEGSDAGEGWRLTKKIAKKLKLNCDVIFASSPENVDEVVEKSLGGTIDLAFVDGLHTDDQQLLDYHAVKKHMAKRSCIVFHDVVNFHMDKSFNTISQDWDGDARLLLRTSSGMGILSSRDIFPEVEPIVDLFTEAF